MDSFESLRKKLEAFCRKFYINELLKGFILFVAIGLLYFLLTLFIEHIFWLDPFGRSFLFWAFIFMETYLFGRFIVYPLLKLFKISKGINHTEASKIIGDHFPEVRDKLLNVLQLNHSSRKTDLLLAGIDQKARNLQPVPFSMAIDFKKNLPYLKYAAIPILILVIIFISGREEAFSGSYDRVIHYKTAYQPPAPFYFTVDTKELKVKENESFNLIVTTQGEIVPEKVSINYLGQSYFLNRVSPGVFSYMFENITESFQFSLSGNKVVSQPYFLEAIKVPRILNLEMQLIFPNHTGLKDRTVEGTGDAIIPEGTKVKWYVETASTNDVDLNLPDTLIHLEREGNSFSYATQIFNSLTYQMSSSNQEVTAFEKLSFELKVIKDEFPKLELQHTTDSLAQDNHFFYGKYSDDHGISRVQMIVYPVSNPNRKIVRRIPSASGNVGEFLNVFPDTLSLDRGEEYELYFQVFDNDVVNGLKSTKSEVFSYRKKTFDEEKEDKLNLQQESIQGLQEFLQEMQLSEEEIEKIKQLKKENSELDFKERKRVEQFLQRQKAQNEIMKSYTKKLKETLIEEENSYNNELKQDLSERLENREAELEENEKLLEELEKYSNKILEEGLKEKLDELSKDAKSRERNLEQLLELTKRYYVQEKLQKISNDLEKLAGQQERLSEVNEETSAAQDSLSKKTNKVLDEIKELNKENESLKEPLSLQRDEISEKEIPKDQKNASEEIQNGNTKDANKTQKSVSEKMKEMSSNLKKQMQAQGMEQLQEDANMLRNILDNLITFSFEQEDLMETFREMGSKSPIYSSKLVKQQILREHFEHIDDSLFSLALRNPMITETINSKIADIDYNLDMAIERLSQNEFRSGVGSQQYIITGANDLAYFLSTVLSNMEQMMSQARGKGDGGDGMQLPDIIQKQKELNEQMEEGIENGEQEGGDSNGDSEQTSEELFRIFQEQQLLRKALEERLKNHSNGKSKNIQREMELIERQLLEKGFDKRTYDRMKRLEHNLLELDNAELQQGEKSERESITGKDDFSNNSIDQIERAKEYFNTTEILNRQSLPLRQIYRQKVKHYFERGDH